MIEQKTAPNKKIRLKRKLMVDGGIILGILAIIIGISIFIGSYHDNLVTDKRRLTAQNSSMRSQNISLLEQYDKAKSSILLYETLTKTNPSEDFSLERDSAIAVLRALNERYRLSDLDVNISGVEELKSDQFQKKTGVVISTRVQLSFKGITDEFIFSFMNALPRKFTGYVKITDFQLNRTGDITNNILFEVGNGKKPALVNGSMTFYWLGLKHNKEEESEETDGEQANAA